MDPKKLSEEISTPSSSPTDVSGNTPLAQKELHNAFHEKIQGVTEQLELKNFSLAEIRKRVLEGGARVKQLGNWPAWMEVSWSLADRVPDPDKPDKNFPGFDAGVASSLDLIPRNYQGLSARLHGNYSKEDIQHIRREAVHKKLSLETDPDVLWWLAACNFCDEDNGVQENQFREQIEQFRKAVSTPEGLLEAAKHGLKLVTEGYELRSFGEISVPYGEKDGCMQAAYLDGYPLAAMYGAKDDIYLIGTYDVSLAELLKDYVNWSSEVDSKNRPKSGKINDKFFKCANQQEFLAVLKHLKAKNPKLFEQEQVA